MALFCFLQIAVQTHIIPCNPDNCSESWVTFKQKGDEICDTGCMTVPCQFDGATYTINETGEFVWDFNTSDCLQSCIQSGCDIDLLANAQVDTECSNPRCGYDGGDQSYCNSGCTDTDLQDVDLRHSSCYNSRCYYQNGFDQQNWCAIGCSQEMATDDICQSQCYTNACFWDNGACNEEHFCDSDYLCHIDFVDDDECHQECWNSDCNQEACRCAPNCDYDMLYNDQCDLECYTEICNYDNGGCADLQCSDGCLYSEIESCKKECLVEQCGFGYVEGEGQCSNTGLRITSMIYLQNSNESKFYDQDSCYNQGQCTAQLMNQSSCEDQCNNELCYYSLGLCNPIGCVNNCQVCSLSTTGSFICYACRQGWKLFGNECLPECPNGTKEVDLEQQMMLSLNFLTQDDSASNKVCFIFDDSNQGMPKEIFVTSKDVAEVGQDGSNTKPYGSLQKAIEQISNAYTIIYLYCGEHLLAQLSNSGYFYNTAQYEDDPIKWIFNFQRITVNQVQIIGLTHENSFLFSECDNDGDIPTIKWNGVTMTVLVNTNIKFANLVIDGRTNFDQAQCTNEFLDYCSYCPNLEQIKDSIWRDDLGNNLQKSQISSASCDSFETISLFYIDQGKLELLNVTISNFKYGLKNIIELFYNSELVMVNVNFNKIKVYEDNYVIQGSQSEIGGSIIWQGGSLKLLNDGFSPAALRNQIVSGFLSSNHLEFIQISQVIFEKNICYDLSSTTVGFSSSYLLVLSNYSQVIIEDITIQNNTYQGFLYLSQDKSYPDEEENGGNKYRNQTHVLIQKVQSTNNFGILSVFMYLNCSKNPQNIIMTDLNFTNDSAHSSQSSVISLVQNENQQTWIENYKQNTLLNDGVTRVNLQYNQVRQQLQNITLTNVRASTYLYFEEMQIIELANIKLIDMQYQNKSPWYDFTMPPLFNDSESYLYNTTFDTILSQFEAANLLGGIQFLQIDGRIAIVSLEVSNIQVNNYATQGYVGVSFTMCKEIYINSAAFSDNINIYNNGLGLLKADIASVDQFNLLIENSEFANNSSDTQSGALHFMATVPNANIIVRNCQFKANVGNIAAGIIIYNIQQIIIESSTFDFNLQALNNKYSIAYNSANIISEPLQFIINQSTFYVHQNLALIIESQDTVNLLINTCNFYGTINSQVGALRIRQIQLTETSVISNSNFINNFSYDQAGGIDLQFTRGILTLDSCTFTGNQASIGAAINVNTGSESNQDIICRTILQNCTINGNKSSTGVLASHSTVSISIIITSNCRFFDNEGSVINMIRVVYTDIGSQFFDNNGLELGTISIEFNSIANLSGTKMYRNKNSNIGGAINIGKKTKLQADNCEFYQNIALKAGGAIAATSYGQIVVTNSEFYRNTTNDRGSAIYISENGEKYLATITNCVFYENQSEIQATLYLIQAYAILDNVLMYSNTSNIYSPGLFAVISWIRILNSQFRDQSGSSGSLIYLTTTCTVEILNSVFSNSSTQKFGGAINVISSNLTIKGSQFSNLIARDKGGAINSSCISILLIEDTSFESCTSENGGAIYGLDTQIQVVQANFLNVSYQAIHSEQQELIVISSIFEAATSQSGGAIICKNCTKLNIQNTTFKNCFSVNYGGAVYVYQQQQQQTEMFQIINTVFDNNFAYNGGAIYTDNVQVNFMSNAFSGNVARQNSSFYSGVGGALNLNCSLFTTCIFQLQGNKFVKNTAELNGGAIAWLNVMPFLIDNTFTDNNAIYGSNVASFGVKLAVVDENDQIIQNLGRGLQIFTMNNIASGQFQQTLNMRVALLDFYNNIVRTDNHSQARLQSSSDISIQGQLEVNAQQGIYAFTNYSVTYNPNSEISIDVVSNAIDTKTANQVGEANNETFTDKASISISFRSCIKGEIITNNGSCFVCTEGTYSLEIESKECLSCPDEAKCYGSWQMVPKSGYWRSNKDTDLFHACKLQSACIGSTDDYDLSYTGECEKGYIGNLCQVCDQGYSRNAPNSCAECPDKSLNILKLAIIIPLATAAVCILVKSTIQSAYKPKALHSIYLKILFNYLQLASLTASFDLDWPQFVMELFSSQEQAGDATSQIISIDCILEEDWEADSKDVFFWKLTIISLIPILLTLIAFIVWGCISIYFKKAKYLKIEMIATIIILLFMVHPNITKAAFSAFSCQQIDPGEWWLVQNLDIRCFEGEQQFYSIFVALPCIIIWGIGIPTICLLLLAAQKKQLKSIIVRLRYGFLFNGYNLKHYFWEFIILYRKIILAALAVFLSTISVEIQALFAMILLLISLYLQLSFNPYTASELNQMEAKSIFVSSITIYCGLFFMTKQLGEESKIILFLVIVLVNAWFILYWLRFMIGAGIIAISQKVNCCKKYFKRGVKDGYDDEIFISARKNKGVVVQGQDKTFTLIYDSQNYQEFQKDEGRKQIENLTSRELYLQVLKHKMTDQN